MLGYSVSEGYADAVRLALDYGADPDQYFGDGGGASRWTALGYAIEKGHMDIAGLLVSNAECASHRKGARKCCTVVLCSITAGALAESQPTYAHPPTHAHTHTRTPALTQ
jgi:hypothetical protein